MLLGFGGLLLFSIPYAGYLTWDWAYYSTLPKLGSFLTTCISIFASLAAASFTGCIAFSLISELIKEHDEAELTKK